MTDNTQELRDALRDLVQFHDNGSGIRYSYDRPEWETAANPLAVRALLAENDALRAELQARQWQPIETAPHETLVVLGWHDENGVFKQEIGLASAGTRYPGGASDMWWHGRATHWMPLPPAPPQGETAC